MVTQLQPTVPASGVSSVILAAAGHYRFEAPAAEAVLPQQLGLVTIETALCSAGFDRVRVLAPSPAGIPRVSEDAVSIVERFRREGAAEPGAVIGISTTSEEYAAFKALSLLLREAFPAAVIVAGGAHFARQHIEGALDPVEMALIDGLADAVQVGHAGGFVDLIVRHGGAFRDADVSGIFHLDPHTARVIGHGRGPYPHVDQLPVAGDPFGDDVHTMIADQCLNGCDFCFLSCRGPARLPMDIAEAGIRNAVERGARRLFLCDSNPLAEEQRDFYAELFARLSGRGQILKAVYLDPSELMRNLDRVVRDALANGYWNFFAGRDAVIEAQARILGAKYRGQVKDQRMLDAEGASLRNFILTMDAQRRREARCVPQQLKLSYVITPFETRESAMAILDDMQEFRGLSSDTMRVTVSVQTLMPYPGTAVRRRLKDAIDLSDFTFGLGGAGHLAPWRKDVGPGLAFMRAVHGLPPSAANDDFLERFLDAIHEHFPRNRVG